MVYGFAKQSGGHAEIDSRAGTGTTVRLYFPEWDGPVAGPAAASDPSPEPLGGSERILVIEDADDVRTAIAGQLRKLGYAVRDAPDGAAALTMLRAGAEVDLVLSDVVMPGTLQGPDLARILRAERPATRVVLMSGYADEALRGAADGAGVARVLRKPVEMRTLSAAIRRALDVA